MVDIYLWDQADVIEGTLVARKWPPGAGNAVTDADNASTVLDGMPEGKRALIFNANDEGEVVSDFYNIADDTPAALVAMITNQPNDADAVTYFDAYFARIAANGSDVDRIILDFEINSMSNAQLLTAAGGVAELRVNMQAVKDDATAWAKIPVWLQDSLVINDFGGSDSSIETQVLWNQWAWWQETAAYRRIIKDVAESELGHEVKISNFRDQVSAISQRSYDENSWDLGTFTPGNTASDAIYLGNSIGGFREVGTTLLPRWNNFIRHLSNARACIAAGFECVPWVGMPGYNGGEAGATAGSYNEPTFLWEEVIKHLYVMGVRTFLWFNEADSWASPEIQVPLAMNAFNALEDLDVTGSVDLTEIPFDSMSVTTGKITTNYDADLVT